MALWNDTGLSVAIGVGGLLLVAAGPARAAEAVPDLSGYWMITFDPLPPHRDPTPLEQTLIDAMADDAVILGDAGLPEFSPGDYGGLEIHDAALAALEGYDPDLQRTVSNTCKPPGLIYSMQGPFAIEIFQADSLIVVKMEYYDAVRIIFLDDTEHPDDWPLSSAGHSIGHWDGETLVVDTARLEPATLFNNGLEHTDGVRLIERFKLSEDRQTLVVTQEFEDPAVFAGRGARVLSLERGEGHVFPYDCDPAYGLAIETRERD
jgi:hypothetical protein